MHASLDQRQIRLAKSGIYSLYNRSYHLGLQLLFVHFQPPNPIFPFGPIGTKGKTIAYEHTVPRPCLGLYTQACGLLVVSTREAFLNYLTYILLI